MENFLMQLFNGLSISSILLLASLGLAITFGLMGIINMAHGEFIMIGAYTTYVVQNIFREYLPSSMFSSYFLVSLLASFVVAGLIGLFLERLIIKHLYGRVLDSLLVTWGVSLVLQQLARSIFGTSNVSVDCPQFLNNNFVLSNGVSLSYKRIFILILSIVCVVLIAYLMYKTKQGRNVRAVMQNRSMAASLGVNTSLIDAGTFAIGSGFAGIAGAAITLLGPVGPTIGSTYIVDTFMTVVVGGVGRIVGCVVGSGVMGLGGSSFEYFTSASLGKVLIFTVVIIVLQFKPKGIFTISSRALDD
ncbi:urea ABC transporter permease subunit UrtB [Clostridium butyricum]|uniref:urea ABC transporter permease subunit UrtB n=1 Tax=Clostridium butyricum TaxID=1492 RepID=UPI0002CA0921|nr:urea ABC transporter permease subunit UrtB [Clostridium butyricum]EMU55717.1 hypothetical protein CBDKU1_04450 [Clostridium butyricum DKU-01]